MQVANIVQIVTYLRQILTTNRTLVLETEDSHTRRTFVADGVITRSKICSEFRKICDEMKICFAPYRVDQALLKADDTSVLIF